MADRRKLYSKRRERCLLALSILRIMKALKMQKKQQRWLSGSGIVKRNL
jgi:hypothetical protein